MNVPPDAGMSLLGTFGLRNPMMVWLLNRRPDLLAETPKELTWEPGTPPVCDTVAPIVYGWPSALAVVLACGACNQPVYVSVRALGLKLTRVCWDCIDEQVPGFVERKLGER